MAFTAGFSVNVGDPTKASDVDVLAANDDYLKNAIDTFIANDANNRVLTGTGSGTANAETNLTFDGSTLTVTGTVSATTFSGNVTGGTISGTTGTFSGDLAVGTNKLFVDVSESRVGINTVSPQGTVHAHLATDKNIRLQVLGAYAGIGALNDDSSSYIQMNLEASNLVVGQYSGGNMGLGVAPSAWSGRTALEIEGASTGYVTSPNGPIAIGSNIYYNGGDKFVGNGYAPLYALSSGNHIWYTSNNNTSGAGAAVTLTQAMTLTNAGLLGISTASPSTKLHVSGASSASALRLDETTSSANSYLGYIDTSGNFGIDVNGGGYLRFAVGGAERARIDSSGNLLVGGTSQSGTANRAAVFSANKFGLSIIDTTAQATGVGGALNLGGNYRSAGDAQAFARIEAVKANSTDANYAYDMAFSTTPNGGTFSEAVRIDSVGRVGINTTDTKNAMLYVEQDSASTAGGIQIGRYEGGASWAISNVGSDLRFGLDSTADGTVNIDAVTVDNQGRVGISTTSPQAPLHIIGGDGDPSAAHSGDAQQILENNGTTFFEFATGTTHYSGITFSDDVATRGAVAYDHGTALGGGADSLHFQTAGSLKAVINASGNFGLGSQSPQYKLVVSNGGAAGYEFNVNGLNSGVNTVVYNRSTSAYVDSAHFALNYYIFTGSTPGEVLRATSAGEVWIKNTSDQGSYNLQVGGTGVWGAGAYVNGSDKRLKKSISTYTDNALDLVNQMRPVTFEYIEDYSDDRTTQIGFIAQDLQEVLQGKEYLDGIVKNDAEHLNVAYQSLIPVLTKAIQELTARIEALEAA